MPPHHGALARFAATLTATPWTLDGRVIADLAAAGYDAAAVETATGVVAVFNYLTRVADATGIELDYPTPLPAFEPDRGQAAVGRPDRSGWPVVPAGMRTFPRLPALTEAWQRWRAYVFESDRPLTRRDRGLLARAAAEQCCDRWRADELAAAEPGSAGEHLLVEFAGKLSSRPWQMRAADLDGLRAAGYAEPALLHAIAVVALQNAESRLAMARAVTEWSS